MDREVVDAKLESLRRCVARIEQKSPSSVNELLEDIDLQDIISVNLQRAVQLCVDIGSHIISDRELDPPTTLGDTFDALSQLALIPDDLCRRLKGAVGFRNIAVHSYRAIDWTIVHAIVSGHISDFPEFARHVTELLDSSE